MSTLFAAFVALAVGGLLLAFVSFLFGYRGRRMSTSASWGNLERENALLRRQNAQLQSDLVAVQGEFDRLWQRVERLCGPALTRASAHMGDGEGTHG